jgi:hypothetical protein
MPCAQATSLFYYMSSSTPGAGRLDSLFYRVELIRDPRIFMYPTRTHRSFLVPFFNPIAQRH